jgi:hypothetical protein
MCVLVLVATAFAGSAYAGDGKGNGENKADTAAALTGPSKTLPFTGFPLWVALIVGLALIAAGLGLLRRAEPTD